MTSRARAYGGGTPKGGRSRRVCWIEVKNGGGSLAKAGRRQRFGRRNLVVGMGCGQKAWRMGLGLLVGGPKGQVGLSKLQPEKQDYPGA